MAKELTSAQFNALDQDLQRMADGIALHKAEPQFPAHLDEKARRAQRKDLEAKRQRFEALTRDAGKAYTDYEAAFVAATKQLAQDHEAVHGFYGKSNPIVADFGARVLRRTGGRRPKPTPPPAS